MSIITDIAGDGMIRVANYVRQTELLGPGKRFALWLQGCFARCRGCVAEEFQPVHGGRVMSIDHLAELILSDDETEGITVSGGEPFLQADKLVVLFGMIKAVRPEYTISIYTGYTAEELTAEGGDTARIITDYADVLTDGRYVEELNDNRGLRGSSNQRILFLTNRYIGSPVYNTENPRQGKFLGDGRSLYMIGVPSKETQKLHIMLKKLGNDNV